MKEFTEKMDINENKENNKIEVTPENQLFQALSFLASEFSRGLKH